MPLDVVYSKRHITIPSQTVIKSHILTVANLIDLVRYRVLNAYGNPHPSWILM